MLQVVEPQALVVLARDYSQCKGGCIMAKSMALIENGTITNMLWCSDSEPETESLIDPADRPVAIGDTYSDGKFYRDGVEILTPLEEALKTNAEYEAALSEIEDRSGGERMTIEERKNVILAKIAEMKAEGADMQEALNLLEVKPDEEVE